MQRLIFVRHGETDWNSTMKYQGISDVPLNRKGMEQARRTSVRLAGWGAEKVFSSPQSRALETSRIICSSDSANKQPEVHPGLSEMCYGDWEGMTVSEIKSEYGDLYSAWRKDPVSYTPPGGESLKDAIERVNDVFKDAFSSDAEKMVFICHGGVIRLALTCLMDIHPSLIWRMKINNCSLSGVQRRQKVASLSFVNDHMHILAHESVLPFLPVPF